jgi:hypothetical protein
MVSKMSSERMSATNKRMGDKISKWMSARTVSDQTRKRMSESLKAIGHKPKFRGGNGTGPTSTQHTLSLMCNLLMEYPINTACSGVQGVPNCYKVDLAEPAVKLAIEVDGGSHNLISRKAADKKKTETLNSLGWCVLRFTNKEVLLGAEQCAEKIRSTISRLKETKTTSQTES